MARTLDQRTLDQRTLDQRTLDQRIVDAWNAHEEAEPDISTERLMEMVRGDTGAEPDRQIVALRRAGLLRRKQ